MKRQFLFGCLFIALAAVIFSTMEVLLKLPAVAGAFHPMQITLERFLVGGICLLPVAGWTLRRKGIRLTRRDVGTFALTGLFCVPLSMVLYQLAITHGQANVVAVLFSGNPIFVTLLAFLLLHETIAWNNLLALVLEVLGIGAIAGLGGSAVSLSSVALAVLAALFFAAYAVLGKRQTARTGSLVVTCGSFLWGGLELGALLLLGRTEVGSALFGQLGLTMFQDVPFLQGLTGQTLPYFLFIGIVNTALGYVFHMLAIEKTSAGASVCPGSAGGSCDPSHSPGHCLLFGREPGEHPARHPSGTKGRARPPGRGGRPTTRRKRKVESLCSLPPLICPPGPAGNTFIITATSCPAATP